MKFGQGAQCASDGLRDAGLIHGTFIMAVSGLMIMVVFGVAAVVV